MRCLHRPIGLSRLVTILSIAVLVCAALAQPAAAITESELKSVNLGYPHYDPTESGACTPNAAVVSPTGSYLPSGPGATLEGHTLPALVGGTGLEEAAVRSGNRIVLAPGTSNPGAPLALAPNGFTDLDIQYYFTMRWRFAVWSWRGDSTPGPESVDWYNAAVRKVLVTNINHPDNPDDDISVVVSVLESGPGPWTGVQEPHEIKEPPYWTGYIDGTPPQYEGRVSGLSPAAYDILSAPTSGELMRKKDGSGPDLYYQWAPDQNTPAGTTYTGVVEGAVTPRVLAEGQGSFVECSGFGALGADFVFYSQYDPAWGNKCYGPTAGNGCQYSTIAEAGCGPSSVAMIASTLTGSKVTPDEVAQYSYDNGWYKGAGTSWGLLNEGPRNWGLTSTAIGTDLERAVSALRNGALVIASGRGTAPYTSFGHILVLRGVTADGKILLGDSNSTLPPEEHINNTREWEQSQIAQGLLGLWIVTKN